MTLSADLRDRPDIVADIDWEADPQSVFQSHQVKSIDSWKQRGLGEVLLFAIANWPPEPPAVVLMRKTHIDSEEMARPPVPPDLVTACLTDQAGQTPPGGLYAVDEAIRDWLWNWLTGR